MRRRPQGNPILHLATLSPARSHLAYFQVTYDEDELADSITLVVRALATQRAVLTIDEALRSPLAIAWGTDETLLVAREAPAQAIELTLHRVADGSPLARARLAAPRRGTIRLAVDRAGRRVVVFGLYGDDGIQRWPCLALPDLAVEAWHDRDAPPWAEALPRGDFDVRALALSPDGERLVAYAWDRRRQTDTAPPDVLACGAARGEGALRLVTLPPCATMASPELGWLQDRALLVSRPSRHGDRGFALRVELDPAPALALLGTGAVVGAAAPDGSVVVAEGHQLTLYGPSGERERTLDLGANPHPVTAVALDAQRAVHALLDPISGPNQRRALHLRFAPDDPVAVATAHAFDSGNARLEETTIGMVALEPRLTAGWWLHAL